MGAERLTEAPRGGGLREELIALRTEVAVGPDDPRLGAVHPAFRPSAENLLAYLALRRRDLRPLQRRLAVRGLSSIGRAEGHVVATLDAVIGVLAALDGDSWAPPDAPPVGFEAGEHALALHTEALLGPAPPERQTRVMVTLPTEAADNPGVARDLVEAGMDIARINCAHDDAEAWEKMVAHVRAAADARGRPCRIAMDLAGPKLRTGPLAPGPRVVKVRPQRDVLGRVTTPARVRLVADDGAHAGIPVSADWIRSLQDGDRIGFRDARGRRRTWTVGEGDAAGRWAEADRTAYLVPGTRLHRLDADEPPGIVGELPPTEVPIPLGAGDRLVLLRDDVRGRPAVRDDDGEVTEPARIGCTFPGVLDDAQPGEAVWFDDGKIGGVIEAVGPEGATVRITSPTTRRRKLRGDKGINLPDSALRLGALTAKDREDLPVVARLADIVGLSFVNGPADVEALQEALAREADGPTPAVLVKIETRRAFEALPEILLAAMRAPVCGVMIARGDLAVECGFGRLAEVQEEVLWVCESAHVPVVWATQVLETLAKSGLPSRAEVTDAAMGHRAECVMLNKGPHVLDAVAALDDIFRRMTDHQTKKRAELRALALAR